MTLSRIERLLADQQCLLADGGMGSALYALGLAVGTAPEVWLRQHPERVVAVHRAFAAAGANIILTNTFGANRRRLALCGLGDHVHALNVTGARLARSGADGVIVAGAVGPLWDASALPESEGIFYEQMEGLAAGGCDLIWIETMVDLGEMRAAARAAARTGRPYVMTASFNRDGRTLAGHTVADVAHMLAALTPPPFAIGCNCGVGPAETLEALAVMRVAAPDARLVAKSNAGVPTVVAGRAIYAVTPDAMGDYARSCRDSGITLIGGCCGTTPAHLAAMRAALDGVT